MIKKLGNLLGWLITIVLALACWGGVAFYFVQLKLSGAIFDSSQQAVCQLMQAAQTQAFVTAEQRAKWAKIATPAEELSGGREFADYYQSDCSLSPQQFAAKRAKGG